MTRGFWVLHLKAQFRCLVIHQWNPCNRVFSPLILQLRIDDSMWGYDITCVLYCNTLQVHWNRTWNDIGAELKKVEAMKHPGQNRPITNHQQRPKVQIVHLILHSWCTSLPGWPMAPAWCSVSRSSESLRRSVVGKGPGLGVWHKIRTMPKD